MNRVYDAFHINRFLKEIFMKRYQEILKRYDHDERELKRYINFIDFCSRYNENNQNDFYVKHHICPREMFPEYKNFSKFPWNRILMTERQHFIAHMMLWKVYRNKSMTYAANMLSNFMGVRYTSKLYELHRKDFRKFISKQNSRPRTEDEKNKMREIITNSLVVYDKRDPNKKKFRIWKDDPEYDKENHVFYRTGSNHSDETKKKIGRPGKISCYNPNTNELKFINDEKDLPNKYVFGYPPGILTADHVKNTIWCHNSKTGKNIRVQKEKIPKDFEKGRIMDKNPGFDRANSMYNIVDLKNRRSTKVFTIDKKIHAPESGRNTENTFVYFFDNKIFTSITMLNLYSNEKYQYFFNNRRSEKNKINICFEEIKPPHHNCKKEIYDFRKKFQGFTYGQLGLEVIKLKDFILQKHEDKEIYWND